MLDFPPFSFPVVTKKIGVTLSSGNTDRNNNQLEVLILLYSIQARKQNMGLHILGPLIKLGSILQINQFTKLYAIGVIYHNNCDC